MQPETNSDAGAPYNCRVIRRSQEQVECPTTSGRIVGMTECPTTSGRIVGITECPKECLTTTREEKKNLTLPNWTSR